MMPSFRDKFTSVHDELIDIYRVGHVVRFEIHTEQGTVMWDFDPNDAVRVGNSMAKAGEALDQPEKT